MSITTLALWQLRRTWFLLLFITFSVIASVVIACTIPLLSEVMTTAGLRATLRATPDSADIQLNAGTAGLSSAVVNNVRGQFDPLLRHSLGSILKPDLSALLSEYTFLVPGDALLALADRLSAANHVNSVQTLNADGFTLLWHYHLDSTQVDINGLDALIQRLAEPQAAVNSQYGYLESTGPFNGIPTFPYLIHVQLTGQVFDFNGNPSILEEYRNQIDVARIPTGLFTVLILSLTLFFVSLMTALLVDRQQEAIALLRSRGASRWQVFGAMFLQSVVLACVALVIGLPLATCVSSPWC